jgi:hypothetical protein
MLSPGGDPPTAVTTRALLDVTPKTAGEGEEVGPSSGAAWSPLVSLDLGDAGQMSFKRYHYAIKYLATDYHYHYKGRFT